MTYHEDVAHGLLAAGNLVGIRRQEFVEAAAGEKGIPQNAADQWRSEGLSVRPLPDLRRSRAGSDQIHAYVATQEVIGEVGNAVGADLHAHQFAPVAGRSLSTAVATPASSAQRGNSPFW